MTQNSSAKVTKQGSLSVTGFETALGLLSTLKEALFNQHEIGSAETNLPNESAIW
jgi:hypothetical protein